MRRILPLLLLLLFAVPISGQVRRCTAAMVPAFCDLATDGIMFFSFDNVSARHDSLTEEGRVKRAFGWNGGYRATVPCEQNRIINDWGVMVAGGVDQGDCATVGVDTVANGSFPCVDGKCIGGTTASETQAAFRWVRWKLKRELLAVEKRRPWTAPRADPPDPVLSPDG